MTEELISRARQYADVDKYDEHELLGALADALEAQLKRTAKIKADAVREAAAEVARDVARAERKGTAEAMATYIGLFLGMIADDLEDSLDPDHAAPAVEESPKLDPFPYVDAQGYRHEHTLRTLDPRQGYSQNLEDYA